MKKKPTIIAAIALMAVLCGCEQIKKNAPPESSIMQDAEEVKTIEYHGHSYICYRFYCKSGYSGWGGASIVHDPDCKCGKRK